MNKLVFPRRNKTRSIFFLLAWSASQFLLIYRFHELIIGSPCCPLVKWQNLKDKGSKCCRHGCRKTREVVSLFNDIFGAKKESLVKNIKTKSRNVIMLSYELIICCRTPVHTDNWKLLKKGKLRCVVHVIMPPFEDERAGLSVGLSVCNLFLSDQ